MSTNFFFFFHLLPPWEGGECCLSPWACGAYPRAGHACMRSYSMFCLLLRKSKKRKHVLGSWFFLASGFAHKREHFLGQYCHQMPNHPSEHEVRKVSSRLLINNRSESFPLEGIKSSVRLTLNSSLTDLWALLVICNSVFFFFFRTITYQPFKKERLLLTIWIVGGFG